MHNYYDLSRSSDGEKMLEAVEKKASKCAPRPVRVTHDENAGKWVMRRVVRAVNAALLIAPSAEARGDAEAGVEMTADANPANPMHEGDAPSNPMQDRDAPPRGVAVLVPESAAPASEDAQPRAMSETTTG